MFNKVILMGRLVADPELRQTPNNISVCRFRIAVDRGYTSNSGEKQADFISVIAWRQSAEFVSKFFSKGKMIIVEGALRNNDYTDNNGVKHYSMEVQADKVAFGESKSASANAMQGTGDFVQPSYSNNQAAPKSSAPDPSLNVGNVADFEEIISDGEVPF